MCLSFQHALHWMSVGARLHVRWLRCCGFDLSDCRCTLPLRPWGQRFKDNALNEFLVKLFNTIARPAHGVRCRPSVRWPFVATHIKAIEPEPSPTIYQACKLAVYLTHESMIAPKSSFCFRFEQNKGAERGLECHC